MKLKRLFIFFIFFGIGGALEVAAQGSSPYYVYHGKHVHLELDGNSLAVRHSIAKTEARQLSQAQAMGVKATSTRSVGFDRWNVLDMQVPIAGEIEARNHIKKLTTAPDIEFGSPVFRGVNGSPIILTSDVMVKFKPEYAASARALLETLAPELSVVEENYGLMHGAYKLRSISRNGFDVLASANKLAEDKHIEWAEPDMIVSGSHEAIPNDPLFAKLWGIHNTGQFSGTAGADMKGDLAWNITTGDMSVKVMVIDCGVQQNHPDIHQLPGIDFTGQGGGGGPVNSCDNHGTMVAGCISASINNGIGVVGIAPTCYVISARTLVANSTCDNTFTGQVSWTVNALAYAAANGIRITNFSNQYFTGPSSALEAEYQYTHDSLNLIHFAAVGNGSTSVYYPASIPVVNAVGAVNSKGVITSFSNHGPALDFVAPGDSVYTTDRTGSAGFSSSDYVNYRGTSFSSPYAAGVAALILSRFPSFTASQVEAKMKNSCVDLGTPSYDTTYGWGFVNAYNAVRSSCIISQPSNITVSAPAGQCGTIVTFPTPTTTGGCSPVTCTPPSGSYFSVGTTYVTCTDTTGNQVVFSVTVTGGSISTGVLRDNFNRANSPLPGSNKWSLILNQISNGSMAIVNNVINTTSSAGNYNWGGVVWDTLMSGGTEASLTLTKKSGVFNYSSLFIYARMNNKDNNTGTGYRLRYMEQSGADLIEIDKVNGYSNATYLTSTTYEVNPGDIITFRVLCDNQTMVALVNGNQVLSYKDATYNPSQWYFAIRSIVFPSPVQFDNFTVSSQSSVLPPPAPVLVSPGNGATNQLTTLLLTWNASNGATSYRCQVATDSLFNSKVVDDSTIVTTTRQVGPLSGSTTYYWKVRASNAGGGSSYSTVWNFSTVVAPPSPPTLTSPGNGSLNQPIALTLNWNPSSGAAAYRLQVATDSLFGTIVLDDSTLTTTSRQPGPLTNNTKYYWHVNAKNGGGTSVYSPTWNFTTIVNPPATPILITPANGVTGQSTTLTLTWNASAGASSYRCQLATDSLFNTKVVDDSAIVTTTRLVGPLSGNTNYFWRVLASNAGGVSTFSSVWNFVTMSGVDTATHHYEYVFIAGWIYVYDIDNGHAFVKTISVPTTAGPRGETVSPGDGMLYISFGGDGGLYGNGSMLQYNLVRDSIGWIKSYAHGIDSHAMSPDGKTIYMPDGELTTDGKWYIVNASDGSETGFINTHGQGPHNTVVSLNGAHIYMGDRNPNNVGNDSFYIASTATNQVIKSIGPMLNGVRPFTINGNETFAFVTITSFLGFQVCDLTAGTIPYTINLTTMGFPNSTCTGSTCQTAPSHGISLSPDEREIYVIDNPNSYVHVFDVSGISQHIAPIKVADIKLQNLLVGSDSGCVYDCVKSGWVHHSRDGRYVYVGQSGDVISTATRTVVANLPALKNSREMLEIDWKNGVPIATTTRTGLGYVTNPLSPSAPTLLSPANGSTSQPTTLTLNWNASATATSYRIQVATDSLFGTTVLDDSTVTLTSRQVNSLAYSTTYYWRVNAKNIAGTSSYSTVWNFTTTSGPPPPPAVPVLLSPANGTTGQPTNLTLNWNPSTGAASYHVQVSTDSLFGATVIDDSTLTITSKQAVSLSNNVTYYWRVCAKNSGGTSVFSSVWNFTTVIAPPPAPTLLSPNNGTVSQPTTIVLNWNASPTATSYRLQVSTDSLFGTTVLNDSTIAGTSRQVSSLANTTKYYWRVNAKNVGGTSPFSSVWNFTTIIAVPSNPVLLSPANGAVNQPITLTLNWNSSPGTATYRIQVSTDSLFGTTMLDDSTVATTLRQVGPLVNTTKYYWRVNAKNAAGTSAFSSSWNFSTIIAAPPAPALASPANGSTNQPSTLTLGWNPATGAVSYRVQVSTDSLFGTIVLNDSTVTVTSRQVGPLANATKYYWRVNAKNIGGVSPYSPVWNFTILPLTPSAPLLSSPANGATCQSTTLTLNWSASIGASTYRVQLAIDSLFATISIDDSTVTTTSRQVASLTGGRTYYWRVNAKSAGGVSPYSTVWFFTTFDTATLRDNFNRADGPLAGSNKWALILNHPSSGAMNIVGNAIQPYSSAGNTNFGGLVWDSLMSAGSEASLTVLQKGGNFIYTSLFIYAKMNNKDYNTGTGYRLRYFEQSGTDILEIHRVGPGYPNSVTIASKNQEINIGDVLTFRVLCDNKTLVVLVNGVQVMSVVDSVYMPSQWYFAVRGCVFPTPVRYDDFKISTPPSLSAFTRRILPSEEQPKTFLLEQNYPDPFNPTTTIRYSLPGYAHVSLVIYNVLGQKIKTLVDETQDAGFKLVEWNSTNDAGNGVTSGVYFYRLNAQGLSGDRHSFSQVRKMLLMK